MNNTVIFSTKGAMDPASWSIIGLSAKPDSDSPIGFFGSGVKYAIAILVREGATVRIETGGTSYEFDAATREFRGKQFEVVRCNGVDLGFTTEMGKQWTIENAYRELVSNTMDEGGTWGSPPHTGNDTNIIITHAGFRECLDNHESFFIGTRTPIAENDLLRIYRGEGSIFYRGVKVGFIEDAMFTYEVLSPVKLTEDRTLYSEYDVYRAIERGIEKLTDKGLLKKLLTAASTYWEHSRYYHGTWGLAMKEVVADIWENSPTKLLPSIQRQVRSNMPEVEFASIDLTDKQQRMLEKAKTFMKDAGYEVHAQIKAISNTDNMNIAFVHNEVIHLTERAFDQGLFYLITTLFEEHSHTLGYSDESRRFEQYLMNELIKVWSDKLEIDL